MMKSPQIPPVHGTTAKGRIAELSRGRSCGVIRSTDGQRVFFHSRVLEGARYNDMEVGASVFFELIADPVSGPRATRVRTTGSERSL